MTLIGCYTDAMEEFFKETIDKNKNNNFEMKNNQFNEYKFDDILDNYDLIFKNYTQNNNTNNDYNKLAIFCLDSNKKYILQDIIDMNNIQKYNNIYNLRVNKNIYIVPLKYITTCLYCFSNKNKSYNDMYYFFNSNYSYSEYKNLSKIIDIPKYSWNLGYGNYKFILLSEENNNIYSFDCEYENSPSIKATFSLEKEMNITNNKIIDFIGDSQKNISTSFLYTQSREVFIVEKQIQLKKYKWLKRNEIKKKEYPLNLTIIPKLKIISLAATYFECYAIDINGYLYEKKKRDYLYNIDNSDEWEEVPLPSNTKKFLQCACGLGNLICLVEDNNGKNKIYAKGNNHAYQCGIDISNVISSERYGADIDFLQKCDEIDDLDFKSISANEYFSSAVTKSGKLYVWGTREINNYNFGPIRKPSLILCENNDKIIVDQIYLDHRNAFAICRILKDGNYIKKLFSLENNNNSIEFPYILKEVKLFDIKENDSRIIPIKLFIGENKTYVLCVNENNLINEINEANTKEKSDSNIEIIINNYQNYVEKLKKLYSSDNLKKFIQLLLNLSDKNIERITKVFDDIKGERDIDELNYDELSLSLKEDNKNNDLLNVFKDNEKDGKSIFNYLKSRISLLEKNIMKYIDANSSLASKSFIQKANIYLSDNTRIKYFYSLFLKMNSMKNLNNNRNMPSIKINRFKANKFYDKYNNDSKKIPDIDFNQTIFGQVFQFYNNKKKVLFLLNKGERLFHVNLENEQAIDAGGPYHEVISCMCNELHTDYIDLFIKTSNNKNNVGELRDKYILNPNLNNNINQKAYEFIGKLMAMAISSGESLNLNLHPIVWKYILEKEISFEDYKTIDSNFYNIINQLEEGLKNKDENLIESFDLNFIIKNSNDSDIELIENGKSINVNLDNTEQFINLAKSQRINEMKNQIEYIKNGLYSSIEKKIMHILNWKQLEEIVCGKDILDIKDFKNHTKYEGYRKRDIVIKWFWEWLKDSKEEDQFKYLKFVSGRTRLPKSIFGLKYIHTITKVGINNSFPRAATCFFTLKLPNYDSKEVFMEKMKYVIENCTDINDH